VNTRVKRLVLPLGGAVAASAVLGASLVTTSTASASPIKSSEYLAKTPADAYSVAQFWLDSNAAALKAAKEYTWNVDYKTDGEKLQVKGGPQPDSKPGMTNPTGFGKVKTTKVKNVNLPKTVGKVFWVDSKGNKWWASGSAIHSKYGNLVVTAAHNVFDGKNVFDKWVFVPGYYKGKAPWGIYVGKQAFTHYDFTVYEDYDKDYAFVTVYNGFQLLPKQEVSKEEYDKWTGDKWVESKEISRREYRRILDKYGPLAPVWRQKIKGEEIVGPNYPGAEKTQVEVTEAQWKKAPLPRGRKPANGSKVIPPKVTHLTKSQYEQLLRDKAAGKVLGKLTRDRRGNYLLIQYYVIQWVKPTKNVKYYLDHFYIGKVKDVGPLAKNVGAQGFAWNQPRGKTVFAFGYPSAPHPNGTPGFTGLTPKWSYGKTYTAVNPKLKAEESIGLKSAMTAGADGGPLIWQYSSAKRVGYINGVISWFGDSDNNGRIDFVASPYFDGETKAIYDAASAAWSGSIVGKNGEILK